jgi:hypothetical protein
MEEAVKNLATPLVEQEVFRLIGIPERPREEFGNLLLHSGERIVVAMCATRNGQLTVRYRGVVEKHKLLIAQFVGLLQPLGYYVLVATIHSRELLSTEEAMIFSEVALQE